MLEHEDAPRCTRASILPWYWFTVDLGSGPTRTANSFYVHLHKQTPANARRHGAIAVPINTKVSATPSSNRLIPAVRV